MNQNCAYADVSLYEYLNINLKNIEGTEYEFNNEPAISTTGSNIDAVFTRNDEHVERCRHFYIPTLHEKSENVAAAFPLIGEILDQVITRIHHLMCFPLMERLFFYINLSFTFLFFHLFPVSLHSYSTRFPSSDHLSLFGNVSIIILLSFFLSKFIFSVIVLFYIFLYSFKPVNCIFLMFLKFCQPAYHQFENVFIKFYLPYSLMVSIISS